MLLKTGCSRCSQIFSTDDGTRIGVVTVGAGGSYELTLRAEYTFDWENTPVKFECKIDGNEYSSRYDSLKDPFASPSVNLTAN